MPSTAHSIEAHAESAPSAMAQLTLGPFSAGSSAGSSAIDEKLSWPEGTPVGEDNRLVQAPPRPVLRPLLDSLPQSLRRQLRSGRDLVRGDRRRPAPPLATAVPAIDRALGGGLPRGGTVELIGHRSSGRFAAVLDTLAAVTRVGEAAALVDLGDHLDPHLAEIAGVCLERLLWLRPRRLKDALKSTEMLLDGGFPLVVLDLGEPPVGRRGAEAFWLRLSRAAEARGAALLVSSPYRISGSGAGAVFELRRRHPLWRGAGRAPRLLTGLGSRLILAKVRHGHPGSEEPWQLGTPATPWTAPWAAVPAPAALPVPAMPRHALTFLSAATAG